MLEALDLVKLLRTKMVSRNEVLCWYKGTYIFASDLTNNNGFYPSTSNKMNINIEFISAKMRMPQSYSIERGSGDSDSIFQINSKYYIHLL